MHPNPAFRGAPAETARAFARRRSFGALTINGPEGPLVAHVPFVLSEDGATAEMHLLRSNPITRLIGAESAPALLIVLGPDAYVSPDWYRAGPDQAPTWNYVSVHLRGVLRAASQDALRPHLERLSAQFETRLAPKPPWTLEKTSDGFFDRMARAIKPFLLEIASIDSTYKLNQNKSEAAREGAAAAISATPDECGLGSDQAAAIAELMRAVKGGDG